MKKYSDKRCVKCHGPIRTACLPPDAPERCVHCADYDPHDPDHAIRGQREAAS